MSEFEPAWLLEARRISQSVLWSGAQIADQADTLPIENIRLLAESGLLGVSVPKEFGGQGGGLKEIAELFEVLSAGCGVTIFVALQHMLACTYVSGGANRPLQERFLRDMGAGKVFATVAFSQVRRPGPPVMKVSRRDEAYVFDGMAPWSTGWGLAQQVVIGGKLDDDQIVFALVPADAPGLTASEPMRMCAMNASRTVTLACHEVQVGADRWIKTISREQLTHNDERGMYLVSSLSHGVTQAALHHMRLLSLHRPTLVLRETIERIQTRLSDVKDQIAEWVDRTDAPEFGAVGTRLRAASVRLSIDAAHAAVIASAGTANGLDHPAQRLFREAMLYSLTAQTRDLQATMLQEIP